MLNTEREPLLMVETLSTISALENSLVSIGKYLSERLAERQHKQPSTCERRVIIDLRTLDLQHAGQGPIGNWQNGDIIYALRLYHSSLLLGPLYQFGSEKGPCPLCLERRWSDNHLQDNRQEELFFQPLAWLTPFALEAIWTIVETTLCTSRKRSINNQGIDQIYELHLDSLYLCQQQLLTHSSCSYCTSRKIDSCEAAVIELSSREKPEISAYHPVNVATYGLPISGYVNPVCGMLGAHTRSTEEHSITTNIGGTFLQRCGSHIVPTSWTGFGATYAECLRHGILEGLERWAGQKPRFKETMIFGSLKDMQDDALDPRECGIYRQNESVVAYTPDLKVPWVWGYSFRQSRPILIPAQCVYYFPDTQFPRFTRETSSGCASGSSMEEAIFFGLLELVERDGIMLTWYANQSPRRIDPWSSSDKQTLFMLDRINRSGYDLHLLDLRFDGHIPAVLAVAVLRNNAFGKLALGAGANFDPDRAISTAMREAGAIMQGFGRHMEDHLDILRAMTQDYTQVVDVLDHGSIYCLPEMAEKAAFLYQNPEVRSIKEAYRDWEAQRPHSFDLRDDVEYGIAEMLKMGMDVIVVDQTTPEQEQMRLKSARVIVPGLLPIDFGWKNVRVLDLPRLRTAPRVAGYRQTNFDPAEYNRHPHPFA